MDITADSINSPRTERLRTACRQHTREELKRLQTKIEMANAVGRQECCYQVGSSMHMTAKETARAILNEIQSRGFHGKAFERSDQLVLCVEWRAPPQPAAGGARGS